MKEIIYYTDNRLDENIARESRKTLILPVVCVSLKPMDFGRNIVINLLPGIITMTKQILAGLEASMADVIFFCEHDVLYHPSHFDFIPPDDKFYYNVNVWRWDYPKNRCITYDRLRSLSGLCAKRKVALEHYKKRINLIERMELKDTSREPKWIRKMGHEPGKSRSPISEVTEEWKSTEPNIDIRHSGTITRRKCRLVDFIHPPTGWQETKLDDEKFTYFRRSIKELQQRT